MSDRRFGVLVRVLVAIGFAVTIAGLAYRAGEARVERNCTCVCEP